MRRLAAVVILISLTALVLSACGGGSKGAAGAVQDYINALVSKNSTRLSALSCADWEPSALLELDSLQAVTARVEGLACSLSGTDGQTSLVTCRGKIIATYNGEEQQLDLSVRTYQVVLQSGDYLVCGYR